MSITTLILGESGTGKSTSLRNLDPSKVLLIQSIHKPLPFRSSDWTILTKENPSGSIFICDNTEVICRAMQRTPKEIIVIDDYQYIMANEFMRRVKEKGYDKFSDIGWKGWAVINQALELPAHKRVYILAHTETDNFGKTKIKTIGKMLDEKITLEGMVTVCLRTHVNDGQYQFSTQNNGQDTVKSPMGLFEQPFIDNDLKFVDDQICDYWGIESQPQPQPKPQENP